MSQWTTSVGRSIVGGLMVAAIACSYNTEEPARATQTDIDLTIGTNAKRIVDNSPEVVLLGGQLQVTTAATPLGNRVVLIVKRDAVQEPTTMDINVSTPIQAGFTVPGSSGTVFFESGSITVSAVDWTVGGLLTGTILELHRPADALGLAPEASANGSFSVLVPAQ
jgi:hypothetical protein